MNVWEWISTTTSVDNVLTTLGLGALAFLFARDLILTKGQHERRTSDLKEHHTAQITEIRASRDGWKAVAIAERARADEATKIGENVGEALEQIGHVLGSLDAALPNPPKGAGH